ncbi:hypothetical protein ACVDFE_01770 [Lentzea chajnantorensis]
MDRLPPRLPPAGGAAAASRLGAAVRLPCGVSCARSARKALDVSLPLNQRVNGLKGCVERYHPIGFARR